MALKKYNPNIKIYVQCLLPENKEQFFMFADQVICIDELKLAVLAHSSLSPGFSTLVYFLTTSFTREVGTRLDFERHRHHCLEAEWTQDFIEGCEQEIYPTSFSRYFVGSSFLEVAELLFSHLGIHLFGIGIPTRRLSPGLPLMPTDALNDFMINKEDEYSIFLNPENYVLTGEEIGFIITSDGNMADLVKNFAPSDRRSSFSETDPLLSSVVEYPSLSEIRKTDSPDTERSARIDLTPIIEPIPLPSKRASSDALSVGDKSHSGPADIPHMNSHDRNYTVSAVDFTPPSRETVPPDDSLMSSSVPNGVSSTRHLRCRTTPVTFRRGPPTPQAQKDLDRRSAKSYATPLQPPPSSHSRPQKSTMSSNSNDQYKYFSELEELRDHIIICDTSPIFPRNLWCFVSPLRAKHLKQHTPIVILSPVRPSHHQWRELSQFPNVYYIQGNPVVSHDLVRARVKHAERAVIFADTSRVGSSAEKTDDASAVMVAYNIRKLNPDLFIVVEFVHSDNMKFVTQFDVAVAADYEDVLAYSTPSFMSGSVFTVSMLDGIICQSYYNPHLVTILKLLLWTAPAPIAATSEFTLPSPTRSTATPNQRIQRPPRQFQRAPTVSSYFNFQRTDTMNTNILDIPQHSHVYQIDIPESFINSTYHQLFVWLVRCRNAIPLGLYRQAEWRLQDLTEKSSMNVNLSNDSGLFNYVSLAPKRSVKIRKGDKVFVLSRILPEVIA